MSVPSDEEMLAAYRATRSHEVFAQIVERHGIGVFRACRRLLGNIPDAEDVTQTVLLRLAQRPEQVNRALAGWLFEAARNCAIDLIRARERRVRREQTIARRNSVLLAVPQPELREELDAALAQLPAPFRQAVIWRYLEERTLEETALLANCPQGTVARRSADGLRRLREILLRRIGAVLAALLAIVPFKVKVGTAVALTVATIGVTTTVVVHQRESLSARDQLPTEEDVLRNTEILSVERLNQEELLPSSKRNNPSVRRDMGRPVVMTDRNGVKHYQVRYTYRAYSARPSPLGSYVTRTSWRYIPVDDPDWQDPTGEQLRVRLLTGIRKLSLHQLNQARNPPPPGSTA